MQRSAEERKATEPFREDLTYATPCKKSASGQKRTKVDGAQVPLNYRLQATAYSVRSAPAFSRA
jgi:hypothetical protein